tara:strand:+ start:15449 stop:15613 length:165 start_codon:yes stop_codon:yes gene_type:complete
VNKGTAKSIKATSSAVRLAEELGVKIESVPPTEEDGTVGVVEVKAYAKTYGKVK